MENMVNIRLELGINAQKMIQQVQIHNENIEDQISKGIELALNDLCEGDNFVQHVREETKRELKNIVHQRVFSYDVQSKIEKAISQKISKKIEDYADGIAEKMINALTK